MDTTNINFDATHDTPGLTCTHCNHGMTNTSGHDIAPDPGDFTICIRCGGVNVFDEDLLLRAPTKNEMKSFASSDVAQTIRTAIMRAKRG